MGRNGCITLKLSYSQLDLLEHVQFAASRKRRFKRMITGCNFECAEHLQCCVTQCHILFVLLVRLGQYRLELILQFVLLVRIAAVT